VRRPPLGVARLEPVFRSNYSRLVTECTLRGEEPAVAVHHVEDAFCILARHWGHVIAFDTPTAWLDSKLLTAQAVERRGNQIPVDSDAAWHAMRARLARDRIWYRTVVAFAMLATAALLLVSLFLESEQFHRGQPPTTTTPTLVR
jgi:hypothetical protein